MDFANGFSFGFDDDMTKSKSGKTTDEGNRIADHIAAMPETTRELSPRKATFAKRITEALDEWKRATSQTQSKLSVKLGLDKSTLSAWKLVGLEESNETVEAIVEYLGVEITSLWKDKLVRKHPPKKVEQSRADKLSYTEKASLLLEGDDAKHFKWLIDNLIKKKN